MSWLHRLVLVTLAVIALVQIPRGVGRTVGTDELDRIQAERAQLVEANRSIAADIEALRAEVRALKTDPRELERIAREDLNLIRPGEVVFELRRPEAPARP